MAVFVPNVLCAKVAVEGLWEGQKVAQTFHFAHSPEPTQSELEALAQDMVDAWNSSMRTSQATNYAVVRVTATRQGSNVDIQGTYTPSSPVAGTGSGESLPTGSAWVFTYRTSFRGRNFRGRGYQPGLLDSIRVSATQGSLSVLSAIAANYVLHLITSAPTGWTWVVASRFLNKAPRSEILLTPVTGVTVDTAIDSQRRRLLGRGA
jgi:hypothetical protein